MKIINQQLPKLSDEWQWIPINEEPKRIFVNYYKEGVQAGFPSPAEGMTDQPLSLDERYLKDPNTTFIVKAKGWSMYPTIFPEDVLIIHTNTEPYHNCIGIFSVNRTDFTVKRLNKKNSILVADNPDFKDIEVEDGDEVICLGVVKHIIRDVD